MKNPATWTTFDAGWGNPKESKAHYIVGNKTLCGKTVPQNPMLTYVEENDRDVCRACKRKAVK